jgi:hypothetical protein|tara:strand:+ start:4512 stop:5045 length:534 start_codon:yes stop_codon:yes gene_type:complete
MAQTGRNLPRTKRTMESREGKQGKRSKSTTKKVVDAVKRGIKNQPIVKGLTNIRNKARSSLQRAADKGRNNTFTKLEAGADTKRKAAEVRKKKDPKNQSLRPKIRPKSIPLTTSLRPKKRPTKKSAEGGSLKSVPESNNGLKKLPTAVRNKMGYMQKGGSCGGMGKAVRGGNFSRNG